MGGVAGGLAILFALHFGPAGVSALAHGQAPDTCAPFGINLAVQPRLQAALGTLQGCTRHDAGPRPGTRPCVTDAPYVVRADLSLEGSKGAAQAACTQTLECWTRKRRSQCSVTLPGGAVEEFDGPTESLSDGEHPVQLGR